MAAIIFKLYLTTIFALPLVSLSLLLIGWDDAAGVCLSVAGGLLLFALLGGLIATIWSL